MKKLSTNYGRQLSYIRFNNHEQQKDQTKPISYDKNEIFDKRGFAYCQILGNFSKAFIICALNNNIYLIDQHAASQKSLYARFLDQKRLLPVNYEGQNLQIENIYKQILFQQKQRLKSLGWTYQIVEQGSVFSKIKLKTVPCIFNEKCKQKQFLQILQSYYQNNMSQISKSQKQYMASTACHNAYRVGHQVSNQNMRQLIDTLYEIAGSYNCPHGRPIIVMVGSIKQLMKRIKKKRIYSLL